MKFIGVQSSLILVLLVCLAWPAGAEELRSSTARKITKSKRAQIIQVSQQEEVVEEPKAKDSGELPTLIDEEKKVEDDKKIEISARRWALQDLESIANANHPILHRDLARIDSARGDMLQAGLYPNPRFDTNNPQVFSQQNTLLNAGIMQEFVVMGKKRLDKAAGVKTVQQSQLAYLQDRFVLLTVLRQQYYVVLAAERRVTALKKLQQVTSQTVEIAKLQEKKQGEIALIDVYVLQLDQQRVESNLENAIRKLQGARNQLAAIVGDESIAKDQFEGNIHDLPPQYDETTLKQFVTLSSAPIQMQRLEIERNEILLQRAIVEPYPNITLGPAMQWGLTNGSEQYWMTVTFPIPTWDRNQGNIQSQRADVAASRQDLAAQQLAALQNVAYAYSQHRAVRVQAAKFEKDIIPNAFNTLKIAIKAFRGGEYDFPRYLQIQRTYVEVNMDYIDLLENVWITAAQLSGLLQLEEFK